MNYTQLADKRDFTITTNALAFLQASWSILENLTKIVGENYILSGCAVTGSSAAPGLVVIGGRLMPFSGGSIQENVRVVTEANEIKVGLGSRTEVSYRAEFGTSTNPADNVAWAQLQANSFLTLISLTHGKVDIAPNQRLITQAEADKLASLQNYSHPSSHSISDVDGLSSALADKVQVLAKGTYGPFDVYDGDIPNNSITISFGSTLSTNNYLVLGALRLNGTSAGGNNDGAFWQV